jgi:hypothetical protein
MKKTIALMKSKRLSWGLLACVCSLAPVVQAQSVPKFGGSYSVTGYKEPDLGGSYTYCFNFTTNGSVLFANSGTWTVPSYSFGWNGTWYQNGDEIIFHGVADGKYLFSWKGRLDSPSTISGRQVEFFLNGDTDTAGTFRGTKVSSCSAAAVEQSFPSLQERGSDPTH